MSAKPLFWAPNGVNESPEVRFVLPMRFIAKLNNGPFKKSIITMVRNRCFSSHIGHRDVKNFPNGMKLGRIVA